MGRVLACCSRVVFPQKQLFPVASFKNIANLPPRMLPEFAVRHRLLRGRPVPAGVARRRVWRGNLPIRRADRCVRRVAGRIVGGAPQLSMTALAFRKRVLPGQPPRRRAITMRLLVRIRRSGSTAFRLRRSVLRAVGQRLWSNAIQRNSRSMPAYAFL